MELKRDNVALLDKICVYNFQISKVENYDYLLEAGIIIVKEKQKNYIEIAGPRQYISSIRIKKTKYFDSFLYEVGKDGHPYGRMEMSVDDAVYHNLNCFTTIEYVEKLKEAKIYLKDEYGIIVNMGECKYKSIEINKTIVINHKFSEYVRTIRLMMYLLPNRLRLREVEYMSESLHPYKASDYKMFPETYAKISRGKEKRLEIKIYDKTKQLERYKITVCHNFLRCEITLNGSKIQEVLGDNGVYNVTDSVINNYFNSFIEQNFILEYEKYCEKRDREIRKILRQHYKPGSHTWVRDVLLEVCDTELSNGIPLVLDVDEIISQLDCLKLLSKQCKYNAKKQFQTVCREKCPTLDDGDSEKLSEIENKLLTK